MIDHDIEGFDVAVHNSVRVGVFEGLEDLEGVETDIHSVELVIELLGLNVRDVLENQTRGLRCLVP